MQQFANATTPSDYDVVVFSRIDLYFQTDIYGWHECDFSKFNFFSRCLPGLLGPPEPSTDAGGAPR